MNRVLALICTVGLLAPAYEARLLRAQDRNATNPRSNDELDAIFKAERNKGKEEEFHFPPGVERPLDNFGDEDFGNQRRPDTDVIYRRRVIMRPVHEEVMEAVSPEEQVEHKRFRAAIQQLKEIRDGDVEKKEEVSKSLRELLGKQFDRDLAHREKELAGLEERVATLRKQLEKRKSAKDEILVLRIKTIANEVEGLGFPGEDGLRDEPDVRHVQPYGAGHGILPGRPQAQRQSDVFVPRRAPPTFEQPTESHPRRK